MECDDGAGPSGTRALIENSFVCVEQIQNNCCPGHISTLVELWVAVELRNDCVFVCT